MTIGFLAGVAMVLALGFYGDMVLLRYHIERDHYGTDPWPAFKDALLWWVRDGG